MRHRGRRRFIQLLDTGDSYRWCIWDVQSRRSRLSFNTEQEASAACQHWNKLWNQGR